MPTPQQLRSRLIKKLKELFQLDQPDLDFGFYRIMHAKSVQVTEFIEKDLLKIAADAFGKADEAKAESFRADYEQAIETAREFGAPEPENAPKVQEAKARWDAARDTATTEGDIYDHLYRFFERYYDSGDFLSRRYYARETPGKAAPYAIPYNGEEVKLHWANADQYYIKTAEYFSNFTFDLTLAPEIRALSDDERAFYKIPNHPVRVHFRIADAAEGEHGNIKASEANKRYFIIHEDLPVEIREDGELAVYFEYRPDPEKSGQEKTWREKRNAQALKKILKTLEDASAAENPDVGSVEPYLRLLKFPAPTGKDKNRPLLAKYINQYTARNTMDYFIHKDLGGFLRRELDFYIKNEVVRLDDIENADAPGVETWLAKVKVLRKIAGKLIDFMAQLEDFQKKLWLKKKFVVETHYCITLDRVPEALYPEIAENVAQHDAWVKLFAIDEIQADTLGNPGYVKPLTVEFLKSNDKLVLDTRFFGAGFKARLVAGIEDFDEQCDGLLIHSENFQGLNSIQERYQESVKCVYIDPPYNTGGDGFFYKDSFKHSSWLTMVENRLSSSLRLLSSSGLFFCSIDESEVTNLRLLLTLLIGDQALTGEFVWKKRAGGDMAAGRGIGISIEHEYVVTTTKSSKGKYRGIEKDNATFSNPDNDPDGSWTTQDLTCNKTREERPTLFYDLVDPATGNVFKCNPYRVWSYEKEKMETMIHRCINGQNFPKIIFPNSPEKKPKLKKFLWERKSDFAPISSWLENKESKEKEKARTGYAPLNSVATKEFAAIFNEKPFIFPKSVGLIKSFIRQSTNDKAILLDYFAGSGTTAHAVINLNREDGGNRKYILVEMADYFDTVLKSRIAKVIYSEKWKDGKPTARQSGISHCFKYIRLESYEDTLNNLVFEDNPIRDKVIESNPSLKEDHMLHYLLDVETRGSQSLLNIDAFQDPTAYTLKVKKPGSDEYTLRHVDLLETFNYLIGLRVVHIAEPQMFTAQFKRIDDPETPEGQKTRLLIDGKLKQVKNSSTADETEAWWFRKVEGWVPGDPLNPDNGKRDPVLIVWRKLTGDLEKDNAVLDEWFRKNRISPKDFEYDTIYVNGSNNLPNLRLDSENWKVRLIEETFMKRMWDVDGGAS